MKNMLKHLFIPCEGNCYKPHFLEKFSMCLMFVLVVITFTLSNLQSLLWINSDWLVSTILPAVIVDLTNEERSDDALATLARNPLLDQAAELKAQDMAENGYFAHYSPDGTSPWHWFDEAGYNYLHAGENLAVHFTDSEDVVNGWMNSPSHRQNIMSGDYTEIGVGTARGEYNGNPTIFVVQLFGTPQRATAVAANPLAEPQVAQASADEINQSTQVLAEQIDQTALSSVADSVQVVTSQIETQVEDVVSGIVEYTPQEAVGFLERSAVQPHFWMQFVYLIFAIMVVGALILSIALEWQRKNPIQVAYAGGLLAIMILLFEMHEALTGGVTIV